jgi:hypothetical protein
MSDFYRKMVHHAAATSLMPAETGPSHPYQPVQTLAGTYVNLPKHQIPLRNPYRGWNLWRYTASGQYSEALRNGSKVNIKLDRRSGSGHIKEVFLRIVVANEDTTDSARYIPAPLWLKDIEFKTPSGELIHNFDGTQQWFMIVNNYDLDSWESVRKELRSSRDYLIGEEFYPSTTQTVTIPLYGTFLSVADFFQPAIDGDLQCNVLFQPDSVIRLSTDNNVKLKIVELSLDCEMEQLRPEDLALQMSQFASERFDAMIPYVRKQEWHQTLSANSTYTLDLSSIKGDVVALWFYLRKQNPVGEQLFHFTPIASFQYKNSEGAPITGQQVVTDDFLRHQRCIKQFLGRFFADRHVYPFIFSESDRAFLSLINIGLKTGAYPFTTNEKLVFTTAPAGVNEVITVTPGAAADDGTFQILFTTPTGSAITPPLAFDATADEIETAIQNLDLFQGKVSVSGAFNTTGDKTITYGGGYSNRPMQRRGYNLVPIFNNMVDSSGALVPVRTTVTTHGKWGMDSGDTYQIEVVAFTTALLSVEKGRVTVITP